MAPKRPWLEGGHGLIFSIELILKVPNMLIEIEKSCLLVIDVQAKLAPTIDEIERVIANTAKLLKGAALLGAPVLVSEQYPKGLGATVEVLASLLPEGCAVIEKDFFSCMSDGNYARRFTGMGREQAVIAGIEAHVCVLQTAMELLGRGVHVFVAADAVSSRTNENHQTALSRMQAAGAHLVTTEMVLFEWLRRSDAPQFKEISKLIKEPS